MLGSGSDLDSMRSVDPADVRSLSSGELQFLPIVDSRGDGSGSLSNFPPDEFRATSAGAATTDGVGRVMGSGDGGLWGECASPPPSPRARWMHAWKAFLSTTCMRAVRACWPDRQWWQRGGRGG
jgi:hypothetical protein